METRDIIASPPKTVTPALTVTAAASVPLSWSGADSGDGNSIVGYDIWYSDSVDGNTFDYWAFLKTVNSGYTSASTDAALPAPRAFRKFRVQTLVDKGPPYNSAWSVESVAVLRAAVPSAPSNVKASPAIWESGSLAIQWDPSVASGTAISKYYLQYSRKSFGGAWGSWVNLANVNALSYAYVPNLNTGERIEYQVYAETADGIFSGFAVSNLVMRAGYKPDRLSPGPGWYVSLPSLCSWRSPVFVSYSKYRTSTNGGLTWSNFVTLGPGVTSFDASSIFNGMPLGNAFCFLVVGVAANGDETEPAYSGLMYRNAAPPAPVLLAPATAACSPDGPFWVVLRMPANPAGLGIKLQYRAGTGAWQDLTALDNSGTLYFKTQLTTSGTHTFRVMDPHGVVSDTVPLTAAVQALSFTDDPLVPGTTRIKAAHMNEPRDKAANLCALYGVAAPAWAEAIVAGTTSVKSFPAHVAEIRAVLAAVYTKLNALGAGVVAAAPVWSADTEDCQPRAEAVMELRRAIRNI